MRQAKAPRDVSAVVARYLADAGVPGVVAPIRSRDDSVVVPGGEFAITVYPYISGRIGIEMELADDTWQALGRFARRLHEAVLPSELAALMPRESYRPPDFERIQLVNAAVAATGRSAPSAPSAAERAALDVWRSHRDRIIALAERANTLGDAVAGRRLPLVACHADLHTGNLIVEPDGRLWVIDWDEVVLAPRERDLMFAIGGGISTDLVSPEATDLFLEGYGPVDIDTEALAYYRHAWAVQDVGGYAWRVILDESASDAQRMEAAEILVGLFRPGEIVDLAERSVGVA